MAYLLLPVAGMRTEYKTIDFDYSYYLGEGYKNTKQTKKTTMLVSNHVSWVDTFIIVKYLSFSPTGDHIFSTLPVSK